MFSIRSFGFSRALKSFTSETSAVLRKTLIILCAAFPAAIYAEEAMQDFGDAPTIELLNDVFGAGEFTGDGYPAAFHSMWFVETGSGSDFVGPYLGVEYPDSENNSQPSVSFNGDDVVNIGDEDGFALDNGNNPIFTLGSNDDVGDTGSFTLTVNSQNTAMVRRADPEEEPPLAVLNAFIDFNADGDWNDSGEEIAFTSTNTEAGASLDRGNNAITFRIPNFGSELVPLRYRAGLFGVRLRVSTAGALPAATTGNPSERTTGAGKDGEVEDHLIEIVPAISVANNFEMLEGSGDSPSGTTFNIPVTVDKTSNQDIHFQVSTSNGTGSFPASGGTAFSNDENNDYLTQTNVEYTIPAGQSSYIIPVQVNPDYVREVDQSFVVTISSVEGATVTNATSTVIIKNDDNTAPTVVLPEGTEFFAVNEDSNITLNLTDFVVTDPDKAEGDTHTLIIGECRSKYMGYTRTENGKKDAVVVDWMPANYTLDGTTITPVPDFHGDLTVPACVKDSFSHGESFSNVLQVPIKVADVNDPPTLDEIDTPDAINEDSGEQTIALSGITVGPENEQDTNTLSFSVSSNNTGLISNASVTHSGFDSTASLTYTPNPNANGLATLTVTVNDGQSANNTASQAFNVAVTATPDAPTIAKGSAISTPEDTPITLSTSNFTVSDPDGGNLTLLLDGDCIRNGRTSIEAKSVVTNHRVDGLTVTPNENYFSKADDDQRPPLSLIACVRDAENNISQSLGFDISVTPVNDPPVISAQRVLQTNNQQPIFLEPLHFTITDVEDSRFTLKVLPGANYTVSGTTITPKAGFEGDLTVPVKANDGKDDSDTFEATVSVAEATKARVKLTVDRTLVEEGQSFVVTATLDQTVDSDVVLRLNLTGDAIFNTDYNLPRGAGSTANKSTANFVDLTIPTGDTSAELIFITAEDNENESDELVSIDTEVISTDSPVQENSTQSKLSKRGSPNAEPAIPVVEVTIVGEPTGPDGDRIAEDPQVDGNEDGTPDATQGNVATTDFTHRVRGSDKLVEDQLTLAAVDQAKPDLKIRNVEIRRLESTVPQDQLDELEADGVLLPDEMIGFNLTEVGVGGCTTAEIILPDANDVPEYKTYYKYGKENPSDAKATLYEFNFDGTTGARFSQRTINGETKNIISLRLCDGKRGDNDGLENGTIVDPGFPGLKNTSGNYGGGAMNVMSMLMLLALAMLRVAGRFMAAAKWLLVMLPLGFAVNVQAEHRAHDGSTAWGGGLGYIFQDDDRRPDTNHSNGFAGRAYYNFDSYQASLLVLCYQANQSECKSMYGLGVDVLNDSKLGKNLFGRLGVGFGLGMTERSNDNRFDLTPYIHGQAGLVKDFNAEWAGTASVHAIYTMDGRTDNTQNAYDDVFVMLGAERRFGASPAAASNQASAAARPASFGSVNFGFAKSSLSNNAKSKVADMAKAAKAYLLSNPNAEFTAHGYSDIGSKGEANAIRLATGRAARLKAALRDHGIDAPIAVKAHAVSVPNLEVGRLHRKAELK